MVPNLGLFAVITSACDDVERFGLLDVDRADDAEDPQADKTSAPMIMGNTRQPSRRARLSWARP